jgi:hypothetical protein
MRQARRLRSQGSGSGRGPLARKEQVRRLRSQGKGQGTAWERGPLTRMRQAGRMRSQGSGSGRGGAFYGAPGHWSHTRASDLLTSSIDPSAPASSVVR